MLHGGVTGGEYDASVGDLSLGVANSSYSVPFLGLYAAVLGHGFFGDVMFRHDFWEGRVSSPAAGLTSARLEWRRKRCDSGSGIYVPFSKWVLRDAIAGIFLHQRLVRQFDSHTRHAFCANSEPRRCQIGVGSCRIDGWRHFRDPLLDFDAEPNRLDLA